MISFRTIGAPRHQNRTAFKHNKNSKKTLTILSLPNEGLCPRCHEIIEWKKKYRKYKPLSTTKRCTKCQEKTIKRAYHTLCDPCARTLKLCAKCQQSSEIVNELKEPPFTRVVPAEGENWLTGTP